MKTITFYSYKGGVGRSLALSQIAIRLSILKKKVCVLDFDLDAPGLRFKFKDYNLSKPIKKGIVDYIYDFSSNGENKVPIKNYVVKLKPVNKAASEISFISAGDILGNEYWKKLSMINWADMFYGKNPHGVAFFLELKSKIDKEIAPDYFLIDSRTGITDISGITLKLLADQVVVLAVNNPENIFGSKKIIKNLLGNNAVGEGLKIDFVLTRLPYSSTEIELENKMIENLREDFKQNLKLANFGISVIHSDVQIKMNDSYVSHRLSLPEQSTSTRDYLKLFDQITENSLKKDELILRIREGELEFEKYQSENNLDLKLKHISKAIDLSPTNYIYYAHRGIVYHQFGRLDDAIADYIAAIKMNDNDPVLKFNMGHFYEQKNELEKALEYFGLAETYGVDAFLAKSRVLFNMSKIEDSINALTRAIEINPLSAKALNSRAHQLRMLGRYAEAFTDISKAIEIEPGQPIFFATLAEVYAVQDKTDEFYLNFSIALSKGLKTASIRTSKDVYARFKNEKRFNELLQKYNVFLDEAD